MSLNEALHRQHDYHKTKQGKNRVQVWHSMGIRRRTRYLLYCSRGKHNKKTSTNVLVLLICVAQTNRGVTTHGGGRFLYFCMFHILHVRGGLLFSLSNISGACFSFVDSFLGHKCVVALLPLLQNALEPLQHSRARRTSK